MSLPVVAIAALVGLIGGSAASRDPSAGRDARALAALARGGRGLGVDGALDGLGNRGLRAARVPRRLSAWSALSPSDLARVPRGQPRARRGSRQRRPRRGLRTGGRIRERARRSSARGLALSPGDLLVVEGAVRRQDASPTRGCSSERPCPEPRGDGDLARFAWQGVGRNLQARARALSAVRDYFAREHFWRWRRRCACPRPGSICIWTRSRPTAAI